MMMMMLMMMMTEGKTNYSDYFGMGELQESQRKKAEFISRAHENQALQSHEPRSELTAHSSQLTTLPVAAGTR